MGQKPKHLVGKVREDRNVATKNIFDCVRFEFKDARTAILSFQSIENEVVLRAVHSLDKFVQKNDANLYALYKMQILQPLLAIIFHEDLYVRRFAAKLVAQLVQIPEVRSELIDEPDRINIFVETLQKEEDAILQEFFSLILSWLTSSPAGVDEILKTRFLSVFMHLLRTATDPDVIRNSIQALCNVIEDPYGIRGFRGSNFRFDILMPIVKNSFVENQEAVLTLIALLTKYPDMQMKFRNIGGLQELLGWLDPENVQKAAHLPMLRILQGYLQDAENAEYLFHIGALAQLVCYANSCQDAALRENVIEAIVTFAQLEVVRNSLYIQKFDLQMISLLKSDSPRLAELACKGLVAMSKHSSALENMFQHNAISDLISLIKDSSRVIDTRQAAALALLVLSKTGNQSLLSALEEKALDDILHTLAGLISEEMTISLISCLRVWSKDSEIRNKMIKHTLVKVLLSSIQSGSSEVKTESCLALCGFLCESPFRQLFLEAPGAMTITKCLKADKLPLRHAATMVIQIAGIDKNIALALANNDAITSMLQKRIVEKVCSSWNTAIDTLLNSNPSVKFSLTGRLDPTDITGSGFYVAPFMKRNHDFHVLENILSSCVSPLHPIFVANFEPPEEVKDSSVELRAKQAQAAAKPKVLDAKGGKSKSKIGPVVTDPVDDLSNYSKLQGDTYLIGYVEELKHIVAEYADVKQQAESIAKFVNNKMSGPAPGIDCTSESLLQHHLNQIKVDISSNLVPIGFIRIGGYQHRAILFKVLADRLGFPCSLVRGENGLLWIEITMVPPDGETVPKRLLRPNCIVDLIHDVGHLIPLDSSEANYYTDSFKRTF